MASGKNTDARLGRRKRKFSLKQIREQPILKGFYKQERS